MVKVSISIAVASERLKNDLEMMGYLLSSNINTTFARFYHSLGENTVNTEQFAITPKRVVDNAYVKTASSCICLWMLFENKNMPINWNKNGWRASKY